MEVLQDTYKDTKIGRITKDWKVVKMKEVVSFSQGTQISNSNLFRENVENKLYRYLYISDFFTDRKIFYTTEKRTNYLVLESDLVIVNTGNTTGKLLTGKTGILCNNAFKITLNNESLSQLYTKQYLDSHFYKKQIANILNSGGQPHLGHKNMGMVWIPVPPLPEQQKIAAILSKVDEQISTTDKIIEKSKELKKGLMQKLFSEGIGHTEFKDTKIGRIPKDWETLKINQVADCYGGTTPSTVVEEYWNGNILWATPSDITKNKSEYLLDTNRKITEQGRASKNLRFVKKNGLLMTSRASIGFLNISNGDVVTNQGFINIECKDNFHYKFFYYWVLDNRKKLLSLSQGSTFLELNRKTFAKINIPVPPLPEQQKIADLLSEADAKIEKEQTQKSQLETLKKGLMQQLLTGKKRVNV